MFQEFQFLDYLHWVLCSATGSRYCLLHLAGGVVQASLVLKALIICHSTSCFLHTAFLSIGMSVYGPSPCAKGS